MNRWRLPKPKRSQRRYLRIRASVITLRIIPGLPQSKSGTLRRSPTHITHESAVPTWIKRRADLGNGGNAIPQLNRIKLNRSI
jgi:hypothetical protein